MAGTGGGDAWRISGEERMKHDSQFFQLKPVNGFITGEQAKGFFMQSGLPTPMLGQIWTLADMNNDGKMDKKEFSIAMHLIKKKLQGFELPKALPQSLKADPSPMSASMAAPMGMSMVTGMPMMSGLAPTNMVASSMTMPIMSNGVNPQMGHMGAQTMGMQVGFDGKPRAGSFGPPQVAQVSQPGGQPAVGFAIPHNSKLRHTQTFNTNDRHKRGHLTGVEARALLVQTGLPQPILAQIWNLADYDKDGKLSCEEFCIALHLADLVKAGVSLPPKLPSELYPAQVRAGSMTGSAPRTGSFTGTPPPHQPAAPQKPDAFGDLLGGMGIPPPVMPQPNVPVDNVVEDLQPVTFEDKRKLNFDKGQAELERRRQMLQDQMRAENNARLEKERQEQEKRERIRQEQERKRLMELERQLEKQRSIEREKEQQRQKMLEQKEAARRESDRQRQMEWERQRKEQLLAEKAREYEQLGVAKTKSSNLKCELDSLREKKKEIGQKIGQVRNGVTDFTSSIESMRITRDNKNAEIERLQNEIMTLDQKFAKLKQDQEFLNVKVQTTIQSNPMAETYRTVLHSVEQKKTTIQKLKKELETLERDTEARLLEIDNTNTELKVLKIKLEDIQKELSKADRQRQDMSNKIFAETQIQKKREEEEQQKRKEEATRITKLAEAASKPEKPAQPAGTNQSSISGAWTADFCNNQTTAESGDKWSAAFSEASISSAGSNDLWGNAFSSQKPDTAKDTKPRTKAKALYQFDARNHDELTLIPGDIILLLADQTGAEPGWLGGEKDGKTGWFPEAYIEHIDSSQPVTDSFSGAVDTEEEYSTPQSVREVRITSPTPGQGEKAPDGLQAQALYPWKAKKDNHLTFNKGDVIVVKEQQDMWWSGELHGQFGWFPKSYVKLIGGIATNTSQSNSRSETPVVSVTEQSRGTPQQMVAAAEEITSQPPVNAASHLNIDSAHSTPTHTIDSARSTPSTLEQQEGECYVAVYSYQSSEPGDLHFNQNDVVMVTKMDGDWWTGSMGERTGIFPHNYVKKMDIPQESLPSVQRLLASRISITELSKEGIYFNKSNAGPTLTQIDQMASPENVRPLEQISSPGDDTFIEDPFSTPQFSLDPFSSDPFGNEVFGKPDGPQNTYSDFGDDPFAGFGSSDMHSKSDDNQDGFRQSQLYSNVDQNSVIGTSSEGTKTASQTGTTASVISTSACETGTTSLSTDTTLSGVSKNANSAITNSESFTSGFDQDPFASSSGFSGQDGNIGFGASFDNIDNSSSQNENVDLFANFEPAPSALDSVDIIVSESTIAHESVDSGVVSSVGQTPPTTLQAENVKTKQKKSIFKFFQRSGEKKTKKKRKESESSNNSDVLESPDTPPVSLGEFQNPVAQTLPAVELSPTGESFSPPIQPMSISSVDQILGENIGVKSFFPTISSSEGSTGTATKGDNQITGNAFEQFDANFDVGSFTDSEVNNNKACQNTTTWPVDNGMDSAQFSFDKGQEHSNIGLDCDDKENLTSSSTSLMDNINTTPVVQSTDMFDSFSSGQFDTFDPGLYEEVIPKTPPKVVEDTHGDMYEDISEIIAARKELDNKKGVVSVGQTRNVAPPRPPAPSKKKVRFQVAEAPKLDVSEIEKSASDEKAPPLPPQRLKRQRKISQEITLKGDNLPSGNDQELSPFSGSAVADDVPPALPDRSGTPTKSEKDKKGGDKKNKKADNKKEKKLNTLPDSEDNSLPIPQRRTKKKLKERAKSVENLSSVEDPKTKGTKKSFWPFRKKSDSVGSGDFSKSMENIGDTVLYEEPVSSKSNEQTEIGDFYEPVGVQNSSTTPKMYLDLPADVRKTTDQPIQESSPIEPDGTQTYDDFIGIGGKTSPDLTILTEVGPKIDIPTQSLEPTEPDGTQTYDDFLGIGGTGFSSTLDESEIGGQFVTDKENCNNVAPGLDSTDFQIQFEQIDKTRNEDGIGVDFEPSLYDSMPTEYENNSGDAVANKNKNDELSTNPNSVSVPANNAFNNISRDDNSNEEKVLTAEDDNMYEEVGSPLRKKLGFEDAIPGPDWNIEEKSKSLSIPTPDEFLVTENKQPDVEKTFGLNEQEDMNNTQSSQSTFFRVRFGPEVTTNCTAEGRST